MRLLPDTHLLLWAAIAPKRISTVAQGLLEDPANELTFSAASIWEIAIKTSRGRAGFAVDPQVVRDALLDNGYAEIEITGRHAIEAASLPPLHNDPFDRMLVAQARLEALLLLTADRRVADYPGPIRRV